MNYIFSSFMFNNVNDDIKNTKKPLPVSSHKFQQNIIDGLIANGKNVTVVNTPRIRYFPNYPKIFFRKSSFSLKNTELGFNIGFINLPVINYITQIFSIYRALSNQISSFSKKNNDKCAILCFNPTIQNIIAMTMVRKKHKNTIICNMLGDLHGKYGMQLTDRAVSLRGKIINKIDIERDKLSEGYDCFCFLTKYMADALQVSHKPYTVIEGLYTDSAAELIPIINTDSDIKSVFYAGALEKEYGLMHLIDSFKMINDNSYRLNIAGGGYAAEFLKEYAADDSRICFLGVITPDEVSKYQTEATVLINPRTSEHEFVKYSFASKNMECLVSGKPYIAHKLPCNPPEYDNYIQYPENETDEALSKKIIEICELPQSEREKIGNKARSFIINEKNPKAMCKRIIDMFDAMK